MATRQQGNPNETHRLNCWALRLVDCLSRFAVMAVSELIDKTATKKPLFSSFIFFFPFFKKNIFPYTSQCACGSSPCLGRAPITSSERASWLTATAAAGAVEANWPSPRPRRSSWSQTRTLNDFHRGHFDTLRSFRFHRHSNMPTTVELPTLQELNVDEVSSGYRSKPKWRTC